MIKSSLHRMFISLIVAGVIFQVGHFAEHLVQFGVWAFGEGKTPYMSPVAKKLSHELGRGLIAKDDAICGPGETVTPRQMMMGMEVLHLIGNSIFLATIAGIFYYWRDSKLIRWALYIEGFHLYEHIMLTSTAYFLKTPIGLSTLFGGAKAMGGAEFLVTYRVGWHFVMNLIPSILVMIALGRAFKKSSSESPSSTALVATP